MKQRITVAQLSKLTDTQKESLYEWWNPQLGDFYIFKYEGEYWTDPDMVETYDGYQKHMNGDGEEPLPLLSIGQMLQFIQEKKPQLKGISKNRFDKWFINIDTAQLGYKDELCDSLWEATTQILKS